MKFIRKILPLTAMVAVAPIPVVATSCSNTWIDLLSEQYTPKNYPQLEAQDITQDDIESTIYDHYLQNSANAFSDFYWSASTYAREILPWTIDGEVQTYLAHVYYGRIDKTTHRVSYKFNIQIQDKRKNEEVGSKTSYSINTFDITWELKNIEFVPAFSTDGSDYEGYVHDFKFWSLVPVKFDVRRGIWYEELSGDEQIVFTFKTVSKGYSETGAQNFIKETNESAIIDADHKYAPQLSEIYTAAMLFDSYYLVNCTPRIALDKLYFYDEWKESETAKEVPLNVTLGSRTTQDYNGCQLTFAYRPNETIIDSDTNFAIDSIVMDPITIVSGTTKLTPIMQINKKEGTDSPKVGDKIHTTIDVKCPACGSHKAWEERLYLTFLVV